MTRQGYESSIKWETQLSLSSFSQKILKKIQQLAFTDKVKAIHVFIPEKVKLFVENDFLEEVKYFQKHYSFEVKLFVENKFIIPEYKIKLFNKSKKIINTIESINILFDKQKIKKKLVKEKKEKKEKVKETLKSKIKIKKVKSKKKIRTLWVRRKKNKLN